MDKKLVALISILIYFGWCDYSINHERIIPAFHHRQTQKNHIASKEIQHQLKKHSTKGGETHMKFNTAPKWKLIQRKNTQQIKTNKGDMTIDLL